VDIIVLLLKAGWDGLIEYLSLHVLTCLVPALFIAGAISVFVSQAAVLKYFGPRANRVLSYGVASVSGTILAVCSCTVLPLFGGIYKRGAGLGPAIAFLYSGPAINVLAIVYTARLLGYDIGLARAVGAIVFSVVIGLIMAAIFRREKAGDDSAAFDALEGESDGKPLWKQIIFFAVLVGILVFGAGQQWIVDGILLAILGIILWRWFTGAELKLWMQETFRFLKLIVPWLLIGVFIAGILKVVIPASAMDRGADTESIHGSGHGERPCAGAASGRPHAFIAQHAGSGEDHGLEENADVCCACGGDGYDHRLYIRVYCPVNFYRRCFYEYQDTRSGMC